MQPLTIREASDLTRMSVSWWRQKIFRKEVRFLKVGRRVLIPRSTVEELLERSVVEPQTPVKRSIAK